MYNVMGLVSFYFLDEKKKLYYDCLDFLLNVILNVFNFNNYLY